MTIKLLLTKPNVKYPVKKQGDGGDVGIPLSLLYLGAYAREQTDTEVEIKDYRLDKALGRKRNFENVMPQYKFLVNEAPALIIRGLFLRLSIAIFSIKKFCS